MAFSIQYPIHCFPGSCVYLIEVIAHNENALKNNGKEKRTQTPVGKKRSMPCLEGLRYDDMQTASTIPITK